MYNNIKKKSNQKGFTLAEMLIVVAIIAVLVAVSIPIFTSKLEKAREATDVAHMRAAKAAAVAAYLSADDESLVKDMQDSSKNVYYDADNGVLTTTKPDPYGQGTSADGGIKYTDYDATGTSGDHTAERIKVTMTDKGEVTISWE